MLFSFLSRKLGSLVQAIFGWSVTALFGRLSGRKQIAVTVALILSIAWPIFVIGLLLPGVAAWVLAFMPIHKWVGDVALRIVWGALALFAPLAIGALIRWAAPSKKGGTLRALINGYPIALGLFSAFLVTAITVPLVKIHSTIKGWSETHVYVQARVGAYHKTLADLAEAFARAGLEPEIDDPPRSMTIATTVLRVLARGAVSPIVAEQVQRVKHRSVEAYLYPSDLLLRGKADCVARVRAMLTRTHIDADAYLVTSERAQCIQDELGRLIGVLDSHEQLHEHVGRALERRLADVWHELVETNLPFEEWVMLEAVARRLERRLVCHQHGDAIMPLDRQGDDLERIAAKVNKQDKQEKKIVMATENPLSERHPEVLEAMRTSDLVKEMFDETKQLMKLEIEMAKEEAKIELKKAERAGIAAAIGLVASILMLSMLSVALVLALGGTPLAALAVAGGFLLISGGAGFYAYSSIPRKPLEHTRHRLESDLNQLKEHIA
jgi:hypothetical protein